MSDSDLDSIPTDVPWLEEKERICEGDQVCVLAEQTDGSVKYAGINYDWRLTQIEPDELKLSNNCVGIIIEVKKTMRPKDKNKSSGYIFIQDLVSQFSCTKDDLPSQKEINDSKSNDRTLPISNQKEYSEQNTDVIRRRDSNNDSRIMRDMNSSKL